MTKQYSIGGFFIDLSRNQITQNKQSQTLAPKALAVLTYLAENQGQVVSQDALLNEVWPDTVVSPNTLQRSIAQLRKAFGDNSKTQVYIKTHAKQGYSLECDVQWHAEISASETHNKAEITAQPRASSFQLKSVLILAGMLILGTVAYSYLAPEKNQPLTFDTLRSLTATDDKEVDASYTPDGQYIVFHRYLDKQCINKIWAKNIHTEEEIQLTQDWGAYGRHSFSQDGNQLVFLATEACLEPVTQKSCYDLVSLDFKQALISPQQPDLILQCKNSTVRKPIWLNNNDVALLQKKGDRWKLINYSISENSSTDLYDVKDGNIIDYAYSTEDDLIAVTSIHNEGKHYLEMIKPEGEILSSHPIKRPPEIGEFRRIYPNFDPLNQQLIFSTGTQLFTLSYEGQVDKINIPFTDKMVQPEFHPDGKKILFIKGPYDSDVVLLTLDELEKAINPLTNQPFQSYLSFQRTNLGESNATFQPAGELIAFWSERSGEDQLWVSAGERARKLTDLPTDSYIRGIDWAADGSSLLISANDVLTQVFLDNTQRTFPSAHPVVRLFQWDSRNNTALVALLINGILKHVEYDLNESTFEVISDQVILWMLKDDEGNLIYKDRMGRFWQSGSVEDRHIKALDSQAGKTKSFVINDNTIYDINTDHQLWSFDLDTAAFKVLGQVSSDIDYLTDINQTQLLMTLKVSAKKEVVELSVSE